ncbi:MAG: methyltransferase domain-containing protein [Thermaurantimonas sp.]|uniref:SAM-dependent methyltransferase n=1 Tax=Thermaurantimonas aggregans TaxID=2173829 RepID=A0A401XJ02_9FLAO|nr:methyltransferase domain-containing protein [Thermaurantimonas aggregans]MCX8148967.1 TPMT family class I SAM-dependent methyltransferase [Thermaurantimonas aggregans]GCD77017.1 SAM-dependent methyltransferase [Thermaurantimonas aggregans]
MKLDQAYWTERWLKGETGWDIGHPSPALIDFAVNHIPTDARILIPGAGNAYEAEELLHLGYSHVYVVDISEVPLRNLKKRFPDFPTNQLLHNDYFNLEGYQFDFILEQTFYCALNPSLRDNYVRKSYELLTSDGQMAGLLFDFPLTEAGPPFGGCYEEYLDRFSRYFEILTLEKTNKSIQPRMGKEFFFHVKKKKPTR